MRGVEFGDRIAPERAVDVGDWIVLDRDEHHAAQLAPDAQRGVEFRQRRRRALLQRSLTALHPR
jgi:hypothetical protein